MQTVPRHRMRGKWLGCALVLAMSCVTEAPAQVRIKLGTAAPAGTSFHGILLEMRERLSDCPGTGIRLSVYPGAVLGNEDAHVRKMRIGQIQAAMLTAAGLAKIDPAINALQKMPLMYRTLDEVDFVRDHLDSTFSRRLRDRGFVALFWADAGWLRFFSKEEGLRPSDFEDMKFFVSASNADEATLLTKAGWRPVPLELSDALAGLRTGMVDVLPTLPIHALAAQFYTAAPHLLQLNWTPLVGALVVTTDIWERLSPPDQECLRVAAQHAGEQIQARGRQENEEAVEAMRIKHGLKVHAVPSRLEVEWREAAQKFWPLIRGSLVPMSIFDEVRRLLTLYRSSQARAAR